MNPRRVTLVGSLPPLLGISAYCAALASALAGLTAVDFMSFREMYPRWAYPGERTEDPSSTPPAHPNLEIRRELSWHSPHGWIRAGLAMRGDVLHVQWWSLPLAPVLATVLAAARARRIPTVVTIHNVQAHERSPAYRTATRVILTLAQRVVVHTQANARQLESDYGVAPQRIDVVPHGILSPPRSRSLSVEEARTQLGIPKDARVVLQFGAIRPYKGIEVALEASRTLLADCPDLHLVIAGSLWDKNHSYDEAIDRLGLAGHVHTHFGYVPEDRIETYFRAADVVILPYRHFAGQSGVGSLALSFGLPLVVSAVGGLDELVLDARSALPPGDAHALAERLRAIFLDADLYERLARDSHQLARDLQWDAIAHKTLSVYRRAIDAA